MAVGFLADRGTVAVIWSCSFGIHVRDNYFHRKLWYYPLRDGSTWILPNEIFITDPCFGPCPTCISYVHRSYVTMDGMDECQFAANVWRVVV